MIYRCDLELYLVSGPSYTLDTACSSSLTAVEHAYRAMRGGFCDSAIVGSSNICLHPYTSLSFFRLGVLSRQGACRSFDRDGMYLLSVRCDMYILIIIIIYYFIRSSINLYRCRISHKNIKIIQVSSYIAFVRNIRILTNEQQWITIN